MLSLDVTTGATNTNLPIKAIDISQDPNNSDVGSANTNVLVVIQNSVFGVKGAGLSIEELNNGNFKSTAR